MKGKALPWSLKEVGCQRQRGSANELIPCCNEIIEQVNQIVRETKSSIKLCSLKGGKEKVEFRVTTISHVMFLMNFNQCEQGQSDGDEISSASQEQARGMIEIKRRCLI